jgi:outer membrane protein assembly factor BamB
MQPTMTIDAGLRVLCTALLAASLATLGGCAWMPRWLGGTPERTAVPTPLAEFKPAFEPRVAWRTNIGPARGAVLQPAVLENAVFAAAADGSVVRLGPVDGKVIWRAETKSPLTAGVGSDGFVVAVGSARGDLIALGADGAELWRAQVGGELRSPPLVGRGLVVVRGTDHRLTAFDAASGKRRWTYQRAVPPLTLRAPTEMAFSGDLIIGGFPGGRLVALAASNGAVRWDVAVSEPRGATEVERLADVVGLPFVAAADVCAASHQGRLACFEVANGSLRWARDVSAASGPAGDDARVYIVDSRSHIASFSRLAGAGAWQQAQLAHRDLSAPLVIRRAVVVGDYAGVVHFLSPEDGAFLARANLGSAISARPVALGGGFIVQAQDGSVALLTAD